MPADSQSIRVFVVDDHPAIRDALRDTCQRYEDLEIIGESGTAEDTFAGLETSSPDVVVVDLSLGDAHGLDLIKSLTAQAPHLQILVYSMYDESVYAERAIQAGAAGYVMKSAPVASLVEGLRRVAKGEIYLSERMTSRIFQKLINPQPPGEDIDIDALTDRELEVFHLLGEGYLLDEIKDKLHVSRSAVDKYRRQAMKKLGCDSIRDLLRYAIRWFHAQGSGRSAAAPDPPASQEASGPPTEETGP